MVGLMLAGLLGWYFIARRTGGNLTTATAPSAAPPPIPDTGLKTGASYGGITFITGQGDASKAAIAAGAVTYDPTTLASAQRRADAVYVATRLNDLNTQKASAYNAANGTNLTPDEYAQLAENLKTQADQATALAELANGGGYVYNPNAGVTPAASAGPAVETRRGVGHFGVASATPPSGPTGTQPPGTYWDYVSNSWKPLTF
jgi:hypothetical protein